MSRFVLGACIGAAGYLLFRRPKDDILDFDFAPPPVHRAEQPRAAEVSNAVQEPLEAVPQPSSATGTFLHAVMWQIFITVAILLAIAQYYGSVERSAAIAGAGVAGVFVTWAVAQATRLAQGGRQRRAAAAAAAAPGKEATHSALSAVEAAEALIAAMGGPKPPPPPQNLSGTWDKDRLLSDSMEPIMGVMRLNPFIRRAVGTAWGVRIRMNRQEFEMSVLSILGFKVTERYPLTGEERRFKRRDLRRGQHQGSASVTQQGHVRLALRWNQPLGGTGSDVFHSPAPGLLHVDSTIEMDSGETVSWRQVYHRRP